MAAKTWQIDELMEASGVKFGTSGARGLATAMTDAVCYTYTAAFIQHLEQRYDLKPGTALAVGGDLRPSTERIMCAAGKAITDKGYTVINCDRLPSPALALYGLDNGIATVMVTGSHIPDDRNGIKYNTVKGEVLKDDEVGMMSQSVTLPEGVFDDDGMFLTPATLPAEEPAATANYIKRYINFYGTSALEGKRIGLYQHSTVGREVYYDILTGLGAKVTKLGFSETFIPVDTEAIRPEDVALAAQWAKEHDFDAIVSADGDADRPLIADENGKWLRGDVAGILCGAYMEAHTAVTPVSCNTAVEKSNIFANVMRTRIGSPYVIAGMQEATASGSRLVIGYEANGGFLLNSDWTMNGNTLKALPTRDATILMVNIIKLADAHANMLSEVVESLPQRFTASDRIQEFPTELSQEKIATFTTGNEMNDVSAIEAAFGQIAGNVKSTDTTDGLRITFDNEEVIHLRPSGNAPELRCYTEADTEARSIEMNKAAIAHMGTWR